MARMNFRAYTPGLQAARTTYFALFALQHRGQEGAGLVTGDGYQFHVHRGSGLVSQVRYILSSCATTQI